MRNAAALALIVSLVQDQPKPQPPSTAALNRFVVFAVLEGLFEDGMPSETVELILSKNEKGEYENFVYACPICTPSVEAFRAFQMRRQFYHGRKGEAYFDARPDALFDEIAKQSKQKRYNQALDALMRRYIRRRLDRLNLSADERAGWLAALKTGREQMKTDYDHCPWCAGAADPK
jgi:hypothetical protein